MDVLDYYAMKTKICLEMLTNEVLWKQIGVNITMWREVEQSIRRA